jgi:hypothetical protein
MKTGPSSICHAAVKIQFYASGKISISAKIWISFPAHPNDLKFQEDHEYLVYFDEHYSSRAIIYFRYTSGK